MGFTGKVCTFLDMCVFLLLWQPLKQAIHPGQIGLIQELFSSSAAELATADNIIKGFEASGGKPFNYQGKVVDTPVVKWAHKIKARAF